MQSCEDNVVSTSMPHWNYCRGQCRRRHSPPQWEWCSLTSPEHLTPSSPPCQQRRSVPCRWPMTWWPGLRTTYPTGYNMSDSSWHCLMWWQKAQAHPRERCCHRSSLLSTPLTSSKTPANIASQSSPTSPLFSAASARTMKRRRVCWGALSAVCPYSPGTLIAHRFLSLSYLLSYLLFLVVAVLSCCRLFTVLFVSVVAVTPQICRLRDQQSLFNSIKTMTNGKWIYW